MRTDCEGRTPCTASREVRDKADVHMALLSCFDFSQASLGAKYGMAINDFMSSNCRTVAVWHVCACCMLHAASTMPACLSILIAHVSQISVIGHALPICIPLFSGVFATYTIVTFQIFCNKITIFTCSGRGGLDGLAFLQRNRSYTNGIEMVRSKLELSKN